MIGRTISHYRILEKLGEGGMGVVYKAQDTRLERAVALKFLPAGAITSEEEKARFLKEARAAAALDHPNICTIYQIEEAEGHTFISMAFVEGESLKDKIDRGPIKADSALDIAIQIAEGLQVAHERGIIHRDVKSANIMLTERNQAKIMDFGLAKLVGREREAKQRSTMGTVAYMSPEQTRGDDVDERADVWSIGVVMYEMLAGVRPFRGDYEQSVIYSIVNEEPEPITALRTGVPVEFERIVLKALSKGPSKRYRHAGELVDDLRRLKADLDSKEVLSRSGVSLGSRRSRVKTAVVPAIVFFAIIVALLGYLQRYVQHEAEGALIPIAVADFVNETGEAELDGLSGMLITALEQSRRLSVVTRTSMFDILERMGRGDVGKIDEALGREICEEANINVLVVASIRKFDDLYSIDLKAFEMGRNEHLFAAREEGRGRASIPGMIDELASKTRKRLKEKSAYIQLSSEKVADVTTPNLEAYQHYFRGDQDINKLRHLEARKAFLRAIELDSTFALAHYRLAYANWWGGESEAIQRAQLERALALIHRLPEKYRFLLRAQYAVLEDGYPAGIEILKGMEKIYPDEKEMIYNIGDYSFHAGEYEQAAEYLERVLEMDPTSERALDHLTKTYTAMKEKENAVKAGERYVHESQSASAYLALSNAYLVDGDMDAALVALQQAPDTAPMSLWVKHEVARVRCMKDDFRTARSILDSLTVVVRDAEEAALRYVTYNSLQGANMYMGRYRDALANADVSIKMRMEAGDSLAAALYYQYKGIVYLWGWNDVERARLQFDEAREIQGRLASATGEEPKKKGQKELMLEYWSNVATYYFMTDRFDEARRIAEEKLAGDRELGERTRFLIYCRMGDCEGAKGIADSLLADPKTGDPSLIWYFLAEAHMEHGNYEDALVNLKQLQSQGHYGGSRSLFYTPSYYLVGHVYEEQGNTSMAIAQYEKFLELWRDADPDLPLLQNARSRLERLKSAATQ